MTRRYYVTHDGNQRSLGLWSGPHDTLAEGRESAKIARVQGLHVVVWSEEADGTDRREERGPGRPPLSDGEETRVIYVRLPESEHAAILAAAKARGEPAAEYVRAVLRRSLARRVAS
jgi:hypothetical protein